MICTRREHADLVLSNTGGDRAPGLHLSSIIKMLMYEKDKKFAPDSPMNMMAIDAGYTWEEIVSHALARRHRNTGIVPGFRPEPFELDGVWMSPDWVNPTSDFPLEEWKSTKTSSNTNPLERQWYWMPQVMGYAYGLWRTKQMEVPKALLRVWYIMGAWDFDKTNDLTLLRDYHEFEVEWSQRELEDNWRMLLQAARKYGLLKSEPTYQEGKWNQTRGPATAVNQPKPSGKARPSSPKTPQPLTFPRTKRS